MVPQNTIFKPSKNLRIIAEGKKALLYNAFYGRGLVCHRDMLDLVETLKPGVLMSQLINRYPQANLEGSIRKLKEKGLIVENGYQEPNLPYRVYPPDVINSGAVINKLRLNVAMTCNMQCAYCYVDTTTKSSEDKMMAWPTAQKALDVFFNLQVKHRYEQSIVRFFGGEPLLNWPVISHSLDYIREINSGIAIEYILNTNGTIFLEPMAQKLADHKVGLAVSVDGIAKDHDRFRKFKTGSGTFRVIMANLKRFLACGCNVGVEATVGDHNIFELDQLVLLIADLQDKYGINIPLSFQHLSIVDRKNLDTTKTREKVEQLLELLEFADIHGVRADTGLVHFPFNALQGQRGCGAYCRAIGGELCIYPDGGVYPCGALPIKLGSIDNIETVFKSDLYHQLVHRVAGNIPPCKGCEIEAFCAGGCAADVFSANETVNAPAKNCVLERKLFQGLVKRFLLSPANLAN
jgi:uncharacterized protein